METRVYIETWGCQMNLRQSEEIAGILARAGYELVPDLNHADVAIFNTCMVRQKAEEKVIGRLGAVVEMRQDHPILLGVGGCMGQVRGDELLQRFGAIDFVFGSSGHGALPSLIERARSQRVAALSEPVFDSEVRVFRRSRVTGMVMITEGCSNFCSYCIVPYARGAMRSRPRSLILGEVRDLRKQGYREVLLLGQNVNAYGVDERAYGDFPSLLAEVAETGIDRVRFTTSHPKDMTEAIISVMSRYTNVCPHLHLACQSGSDAVLQAMNRNYNRDQYLSIVRMARSMVPELNVTTDLIVGFPRESDKDFERTMDLMEAVRFGSVFVAKYSPRPRTRAAQWPDSVPEATKEERLQRILSRQRTLALEENGRFISRDVEVLIEAKARNGEWLGRAEDHRTVVARGSAEIGELVTVRVDGASASSLSGGILVRERLGGMT